MLSKGKGELKSEEKGGRGNNAHWVIKTQKKGKEKLRRPTPTCAKYYVPLQTQKGGSLKKREKKNRCNGGGEEKETSLEDEVEKGR